MSLTAEDWRNWEVEDWPLWDYTFNVDDDFFERKDFIGGRYSAMIIFIGYGHLLDEE